jgi:hypothetical protein
MNFLNEIKPVATFKLPVAPCAWRMATIGHRCFKLFEKNNVLLSDLSFVSSIALTVGNI